VTPLLEIDWVTEERHRAAMEAVLAAGRKKPRLVDCTSFQRYTSGWIGIARHLSFASGWRYRSSPLDLKFARDWPCAHVIVALSSDNNSAERFSAYRCLPSGAVENVVLVT
jgi:hypothetical protein